METWPDGAKYEGEYDMGKKHGKGKKSLSLKENFIGQMDLLMKESSTIIIFMVKGLMNGQMEENIKDNGKIIRWMEMENLLGLMEENIKDSMLMIKNKVILLIF